MKNSSKPNLILILVICLSCSLFLECRHYYLPDNIDSKVISMLEKLPSQFERGNISPKDGRLLYDIILQKGYKHGLEIGTSNGYSALWQGLALKQNNGRLVTIEIDSIAGHEAQENFAKAGLQDLIDLKIDDARNVLKGTNDTYDFVFVDTGTSSLDFFNVAFPFVCNGGTIVIHNVNKRDPQIKKIINSSDLKAIIRSHLFYSVLICTKNNK